MKTKASQTLSAHRVPNGPAQFFATCQVLAYLAGRYGEARTRRHTSAVLKACNK